MWSEYNYEFHKNQTATPRMYLTTSAYNIRATDLGDPVPMGKTRHGHGLPRSMGSAPHGQKFTAPLRRIHLGM